MRHTYTFHRINSAYLQPDGQRTPTQVTHLNSGFGISQERGGVQSQKRRQLIIWPISPKFACTFKELSPRGRTSPAPINAATVSGVKSLPNHFNQPALASLFFK